VSRCFYKNIAAQINILILFSVKFEVQNQPFYVAIYTQRIGCKQEINDILKEQPV